MASILSAGTTSNTALNLSGDTSGVLQLATNGTTTAVTIDTSQNVGIGTASPLARIDSRSANNGINSYGQLFLCTTDSQAADKGGAISFGGAFTGTTVTYWAGITGAKENSTDGQYGGYMAFGTRPNGGSTTERMRIDASGNVLIGQSSLINNEKLLVRDNVASSVNIRVRNDSTSASAGAAIAMNASGNVWGIECGSSAKNSNALTWILDYGGTNAERLRLNTDGTLILRGGSTSATGTGITFPATQSASSDANTLDDYEEGTFTPTATAASPGGTPPTFAYDFRYTKIGRTVSITGYFFISNAGTASGNLNFTGFPFSSGNFSYAPVGDATEQALTNQLCQMRVENNSTSGRVTAVNGGGVVWTTGGQYVVSITYIAA